MLNNTAVDDLTKTFAMVPCSQADLIWPDGTSTFDKKNQQHNLNVKFQYIITYAVRNTIREFWRTWITVAAPIAALALPLTSDKENVKVTTLKVKGRVQPHKSTVLQFYVCFFLF